MHISENHIKTKVMEELNIEGEKEVRCDYLNMGQISKEITDQNLYRGVCQYTICIVQNNKINTRAYGDSSVS